ncbi:MAG: alanine--glyoxylate aminotransferase family protein, partial [Chloroflexi bacterium]|nr:alanine--glyoxylate aminotransferase family protein [Chloroflexota bacterium]
GGLQKCLGGPPGMALVTLSAAACSARARRRAPSPPSFLDIAVHQAAWVEHADLEACETSGSMLLAMREALELIHIDGLDARWRRHERASRALRAGLCAMGLRLFADPARRVPMITLVAVPDGIAEQAVREQLLADHAVEIMAAFGPLRGRVWRIGTMGTNACLPSVLALLAALESVLAARGFSLPQPRAPGGAVAAALAEDHAPISRGEEHEHAVGGESESDDAQQPRS